MDTLGPLSLAGLVEIGLLNPITVIASVIAVLGLVIWGLRSPQVGFFVSILFVAAGVGSMIAASLIYGLFDDSARRFLGICGIAGAISGGVLLFVSLFRLPDKRAVDSGYLSPWWAAFRGALIIHPILSIFLFGFGFVFGCSTPGLHPNGPPPAVSGLTGGVNAVFTQLLIYLFTGGLALLIASAVGAVIGLAFRWRLTSLLYPRKARQDTEYRR